MNVLQIFHRCPLQHWHLVVSHVLLKVCMESRRAGNPKGTSRRDRRCAQRPLRSNVNDIWTLPRPSGNQEKLHRQTNTDLFVSGKRHGGNFHPFLFAFQNRRPNHIDLMTTFPQTGNESLQSNGYAVGLGSVCIANKGDFHDRIWWSLLCISPGKI